jgi:hypothetical protein
MVSVSADVGRLRAALDAEPMDWAGRMALADALEECGDSEGAARARRRAECVRGGWSWADECGPAVRAMGENVAHQWQWGSMVRVVWGVDPWPDAFAVRPPGATGAQVRITDTTGADLGMWHRYDTVGDDLYAVVLWYGEPGTGAGPCAIALVLHPDQCPE